MQLSFNFDSERGARIEAGAMRIRLKRSVWQQHRHLVRDAKGLSLHRMWTPNGATREVLCEREEGLEIIDLLAGYGIEAEVLDGGPA